MGIETSCDDTGVAIVSRDPTTGRGVVHSEVLQSQWQLVARYGGVFPDEARRAHASVIDGLVEAALKAAKMTPKDLAAVAVTLGPGLAPCLAVGANKARTLCKENQLPLIGVNHLLAHTLTPLMSSDLPSPFLTLLVSGGHTALVLCNGQGGEASRCVDPSQYRLLGHCLDDSLGEAFDKVWRLLLSTLEKLPDVAPDALEHWRHGHPGAALEELASRAEPEQLMFTVPMLGRPDSMDFSFSGLKTQVGRHLVRCPPQSLADVARIAASFQATALSHIFRQLLKGVAVAREESLLQATKKGKKLEIPLVVSGGVASNMRLRKLLLRVPDVKLYIPPQPLCVDNGVMVAWAGALMRDAGETGLRTPEELESMWFDPSWALGPISGVKKRNPVARKQ